MEEPNWEHWRIIEDWLEKRELVGNMKGSIYFITHENIGELFRALYGRDYKGSAAVNFIGEAAIRERNG